MFDEMIARPVSQITTVTLTTVTQACSIDHENTAFVIWRRTKQANIAFKCFTALEKNINVGILARFTYMAKRVKAERGRKDGRR